MQEINTLKNTINVKVYDLFGDIRNIEYDSNKKVSEMFNYILEHFKYDQDTFYVQIIGLSNADSSSETLLSELPGFLMTENCLNIVVFGKKQVTKKEKKTPAQKRSIFNLRDEILYELHKLPDELKSKRNKESKEEE